MDNDPRFDYHKFIESVLIQDRNEVTIKDVSYGASWKKREGVGAYMMLARKMDRLEEIMKTFNYDIFEAISSGPKGEDGTVLAEVRDLRRYLLLVEAEMCHRLQPTPPPYPFDHQDRP